MKTELHEAERYFHRLFLGAHHCPQIKPFGQGFKVAAHDGMATFDSNLLTRMVFLAHDLCVRVELLQSGPCRIGIAMWQRRRRDGDSYGRHPTLEQAVSDWRERNGFDGEVPASTVTAPGLGPKGGKHYVKQCGYAAMPGTGPAGETCGSCKHVARGGQSKKFLKCVLVKGKWTHSQKSDVLSRSPACSRWEQQP